MDVRLLGPLIAEERGVAVVPSAHKPRQVLGLLAARAGGVVTVSDLMEEIWGDKVPRTGATTLQVYILQLRRLIGHALQDETARRAKDVLITHHGGYELAIGAGWSDVAEFNRLVDAGRRAARLGDDLSASHLLGSALALWRGSVLVDVRHGRQLELEALGLQESRMSALELRIESDIRLGRHREVVSELRVLTARYPMHEMLCLLLMVALYRSGNGPRALDAFHALRRTLHEELGVEPSARIRSVQQAVLNGDPVAELACEPAAAERLAL